MKLFSWQHFNLPAVFAKLDLGGISPPKVQSDEGRGVADALDHPHVRFYNPDDLHFPVKDWATPHHHGELPGNANVTLGTGMVVYDHQAQWSRDCDAGPVRHFFHRQYYDNRIKHL
ncbi:MAG: hypothetical protein KGJ13_06705 [Patescibacteria group bacterium]|nr:hypothetical protein [Patescibacteria group bacterium]